MKFLTRHVEELFVIFAFIVVISCFVAIWVSCTGCVPPNPKDPSTYDDACKTWLELRGKVPDGGAD